jgi:phage terminase small subunit
MVKNYQDESNDSVKQRIKPPSYLSKFSKNIFMEIVNSLPVSHFAPCDAYTLGLYCEALEDIKNARKELKKGPKVIIKPDGTEQVSGWASIIKSQQATIASLVVKLRIAPSARYSNTQAKLDFNPVPSNPDRDHLLDE